MKKNKIIVTSALLSALASAVLCLGSMLGDLDLTFAAAASLPVFWAMLELGTKPAVAVWLVTSATSFMLAPSKFAAAMFALFVGVYPILKLCSERLRPMISWSIKIISVNIATVIIILLARFVFFPGMKEAWWVYVLTLILANAATVIFDMLLGRLAVIYFAKFRKKLGISKFINDKNNKNK